MLFPGTVRKISESHSQSALSGLLTRRTASENLIQTTRPLKSATPGISHIPGSLGNPCRTEAKTKFSFHVVDKCRVALRALAAGSFAVLPVHFSARRRSRR